MAITNDFVNLTGNLINKLQKMEGELSQKQQEQLGEVNLAFGGVEPVVRGINHWADQANAAVALNKRMMEALQNSP